MVLQLGNSCYLRTRYEWTLLILFMWVFFFQKYQIDNAFILLSRV